MEKNQNILNYLQKYKKKYDIKFADENSKLFKGFYIAAVIIWIYSFFWLALSTLSFGLNFAARALLYSDFKKVFWLTLTCFCAMIAAAALYICRQKIAGLSLAIAAQPVLVFTYKPISVYGFGYMPKFYYAYLIPAILIVLIAGIMLFILIRAIVKENKLYNQVVYDIYKQHGTRDGEKLDEQEWQEFLDNYDPNKQNDLNNPQV